MGLGDRKRFYRGWGWRGAKEQEGERRRYNKKIAFNLLLFLTGSPL